MSEEILREEYFIIVDEEDKIHSNGYAYDINPLTVETYGFRDLETGIAELYKLNKTNRSIRALRKVTISIAW